MRAAGVKLPGSMRIRPAHQPPAPTDARLSRPVRSAQHCSWSQYALLHRAFRRRWCIRHPSALQQGPPVPADWAAAGTSACVAPLGRPGGCGEFAHLSCLLQ